MNALNYRIESSHPKVCPLLSASLETAALMSDSETAVAVAAKSVTQPSGHEIRVVYIPTGEVIFSKSVDNHDASPADPKMNAGASRPAGRP